MRNQFLTVLALVWVTVACAPAVRVVDNADVTNRGSDKDKWWSELPRPAWQKFRKIDNSQTWFEVYEVADGVYAIYEPGQFEEVISYLITGTEQALLFDTGLGIGNMRELVSELVDINVIVLNSHTHYDHIGGNYQFDSIVARDTAYSRNRAEGLTHGDVAFAVGDGWIWKPTPADYSSANYRIRPFSVSRYAADRERIDLGGRTLEVLFTPGHAPDAVCLIDRQNRLLFTGDTFYPAPLYAHLDGSDFDEYAESARLLSTFANDIDLLMPAHNEAAVPANYLVRMRDAFDAIDAGMTPTTVADGNLEYDFGDFAILTKADR